MKHKLLLFLVLLANVACFANMASPMQTGTHGTAPFTSREVDIVREQMRIVPDRKFQKAVFYIDYFIQSDRDGRQIPLLFYAMDYMTDFKVWLDDMPVLLSRR